MSSASTGPADLQTAIAHFESGRLAEAEAACRAVLAARPGEIEARHLLGVLALRGGRAGEALDILAAAAGEAPGHARLLYAHGVALQASGRADEAAARYRAALALDGSLAEAQNNLGVILLSQGRAEEAAAALDAAVKLAPDNPGARHNLGRALRALGALDEAAACFARVAAQAPGDIGTLTQLGEVHMARRDFAAAEDAYRRILDADPGNVAAQLCIAWARKAAGDLTGAMAINRALIEAGHDLINVHVTQADMLAALGRQDEARAHYLRALDAAPGGGRPAALLARALAQTGGEAALARLEAMLADGALRPRETAEIHLAIARLCDRGGEHERAFRHCAAGNAIRSRQSGFDPAAHADGIDHAIAVFDPPLFERMAGWGAPDPLPVFVVGMPRSGTTLVEQILASHPAVFGAGELEDIGAIPMTIIRRTGTDSLFPESVRALTPTLTQEIAAAHLVRLRALAGGDAARAVDKNPFNFYMLGLIAVLFPGATVLHCRRDPLDTCLSCFFTNFEKDTGFNRDLGHLGAFYRDYARLMAHWHGVLPLRILDVQYEELVADLEGQSRRMVEFAGLGWDDACLEFWRTERVVRTASNLQVRRPIYTSSIGRADAYRPWLGPLIDALAARA
jgi:tetratricopeptide (TPR) repeat protein